MARANHRLYQMTNGRFQLAMQETAQNNRGKTGLDLDVIDHYTGKRRSVKTLSGGEAFQASLSLALGLSDVVQRRSGGIQLDALFLDEGFGTLDEEALRQAGNQIHPQPPQKAQPDLPAAIADLLQLRNPGIKTGEGPVHNFLKGLAVPGQADVSPVSLKKRHAQLLLQLPDGIAEGRLGDT